MELVLIYLGSVIASFILELDNGFQMFKDVADAEYKIDIDKMAEFINKMRNNQKQESLLRIFVPIYNVLRAMQIRMQYIQQRFLVLDQLNAMDCIEEMTETEKIEYAKKTTGLNAILIPLKANIELSKAIKIEIKDEGAIWYTLEEKTNEIKIVKAEGQLAKLSLEEQKSKIDEVNIRLAKKFVESFDSFEDLKKGMIETAESGNILDLDNYTKSPTEKIEELKENLTQQEKSNQEEKGYQKTNKKDK